MILLLAALALARGPQDPGVGEPPRSLFTAPLYLEPDPPECRAAAVILIAEARRAPGEAGELAARLVGRARAGEGFATLARSFSDGPEGSRGGVLGSLPAGVLEEPVDRFLFTAEVGDVSEPIPTASGLTIWTRIERWAACEYVLVPETDTTALERAQELAATVRAGGSLDAAAEAVGLRPARAAFERGANDRLLKLATFECLVGQVFGPLETPLGTVVGRRIPLEEVAREERENHWIRARALVLRTPDDLSDEERTRQLVAARERIRELHSRVGAGERLEDLVRELTEEPTARARAGDLGWLHRFSPTRSRLLDGLFVVEPGTVLDPIAFQGGWVLLERTR